MSYHDCSPSYPAFTPLAIPSSMPSYNPVSSNSTAQGPPPSTLDRRPFTQPTSQSSLSPYSMQGQTGLALLPPPPPPPLPRRPRTHHTYGERESASSYHDPSGMRPNGRGIPGQGQGHFHPPGSDLRTYPTTSQSFGTHYRTQDSHYNGSDLGVGGSRSCSSTNTPIIPNPQYFPPSDPNHFLKLNASNDRGGPGPKTLSMGSRHGRERKRSSPGPALNDRILPGVSGNEAHEQSVREAIGQTSGKSSETGVHDILETYRTLRSRLPRVLAKFGSGGEKNGPTGQSSNTHDDGYLVSPGMEQEELREVLKLAMDGFRMVGSICGNKKATGGVRSGSENEAGLFTVDLAGKPGSTFRDLPSRQSSEVVNDVKPVVTPHSSLPPGASPLPSSVTPVSGMESAPTLSSSNSESTITLASGRQRSNDLPESSSYKLDGGSGTMNDRPTSHLAEATANEGAGSSLQSLNANGSPICLGCGATGTPEWRRGPMGPRTLCNACGLVFAKLVRKRAREAAKAQAIAKGLVPAKKTRAKKAAKESNTKSNL